MPPSALDAEAAVVSSILLDGAALDLVTPILEHWHFYADANSQIYQAILALSENGRPVDVVSVAGWLRDRGRLEQIGGTPYLAQLADATPAVAHVIDHAEMVRDKWRLREAVATCQRLVVKGLDVPTDVQEFLEDAESSIFRLAQNPDQGRIVELRDAVLAVVRMLEEMERRGAGVAGVQTGFTRVDRQTTGLHEGDLVIIAGRPGMGKTQYALQVAQHVAATQGPALFCTLEMPKEQLAARLLACEARIDMSAIRGGSMSREDWTNLTEAASSLCRVPLYLDDAPALTLQALRSKVRSLQAELARTNDVHGNPLRLKLVAIDYLQLMQGRRDAGSREQEISELSRGLKALAKEAKVPIIALSQLNRAVETRSTKDKRPQLSDLRESGAIEQDADTIMFIYRDEYYFKESEAKGIAEIIVAKQRNGPTGTVLTRFTSAFTRFDNLEGVEIDEFDDFAFGDAAGGAWP
jgi:replicative DNA helicase